MVERLGRGALRPGSSMRLPAGKPDSSVALYSAIFLEMLPINLNFLTYFGRFMEEKKT